MDNRFEALKSSIGYLIHNSYNPSSNQAILLYDEALTSSSKPQGGTGKSLLANAIKKVRMTTKIDINQCYCFYQDDFVASFEFKNIVGTQFHPELSQTNGLKLLRNFIENF